MNTLKFIERHTYIDNCLRSHKRPPSPLLKWSQILNFLTSGSTIMFKWPGKNYNITYKLSLDFRIIKTMLRVLGDFSKTGQLWNRFDDSNTKSSHQGNILTISGHLDVIQLISDKKWWKNGKPGPKHQGNCNDWKWLSETTDFTFSTKKIPLFSPFLCCVRVDFQKQDKNLE